MFLSFFIFLSTFLPMTEECSWSFGIIPSAGTTIDRSDVNGGEQFTYIAAITQDTACNHPINFYWEWYRWEDENGDPISYGPTACKLGGDGHIFVRNIKSVPDDAAVLVVKLRAECYGECGNEADQEYEFPVVD